VSEQGHERYSIGYGPQMLQALRRRSAAKEAAFFVPHLRPGMSVLDCGCGPGSITVHFAELVAPGEVVGIDIEGEQLAMGESLARARGLSNVRFSAGDIYDLPFPEATFDAVFAHGVLYHLRAPEKALGEMFRVLRPGGIIGIRDADEASSVHAPESPVLARAVGLVLRAWEHNGVNLRFGRHQRRSLREAGFADIEASASYDSFGTPRATRSFGALLANLILEPQIAEPILQEGWATRPELEEMSQAARSWGEHPDAFWARCRCEAVARKPVTCS
jgi:ubiquinone/menaquinone biosynthesis C-methylase UbiE